jgi:hypothetical protein
MSPARLRIARRRRAGVALVAVAVAASTACHRIVAEREVPPRDFVGGTLDGGLVGVVFTDSLEACMRGSGEARFLPFAGHGWIAEDLHLLLSCRRIIPLTSQELSRVLGGRGSARGGSPIPENRDPIEYDHRGYHRVSGRWIGTEYFVRYNDTAIRLVRWGYGNHWGGETDHTYHVEDVNGRRVIHTVRSKERDVVLD